MSPPEARHAPTDPADPGRAARRTLVGVAGAAGAATLAALAVSGGPAEAVIADPGALTRWGRPLAGAVTDLAAVGTVGTLLVGAVLLPATAQLSALALRLLRAASAWAALWSVSALVSAVLTASEVFGASLAQMVEVDGLVSMVLAQDQARALLSSAWLAAVAAGGARWASTRTTGLAVFAVSLAALVPPLLTGHSTHGDSPTLAAASLVAHVGAAALWVGGLLALAVHLRSQPAALARAVPRFSAVALGAFVVVAASGAVNAWTRLESLSQLWTSEYGQLLIVKTVLLGVLGAVGWRHRRGTVERVRSGRPRAFLALAVGEVLVMAATVGLAVGLSRTPPPVELTVPVAAAAPVAVATTTAG